MENLESNTTQNEDEISLIDLFAVLLRYRKLIIIGTAVITIFTGVYLFIIPKVFKSFLTRELSVSYTVSMYELPAVISNELGFKKISDTALQYMNDYQFFAGIYKKNPFLSKQETFSNYDYNLFVKNLIDKKIISFSLAASNTFRIDFKCPESKYDESAAFVADLIASINAALESEFNPLLHNLEEITLVSLKNIDSLNTAEGSIYRSLENIRQSIAQYKYNFKNYLQIESDPFILPEFQAISQGRAKKLIIVFFASFFIMVFIAFLKNAVQNIKQDPVASKTLSDAWNSGK